MYHHVSDTVQPGPYARALTVTPVEFAQQLAWLRKRGCESVSVSTIIADVAWQSLRGCEVAITIDDGYDDAVTHAFPILQEFGDTATFYVTSGFLGTPGHMSGAQVKRLAQAGMEIGAHTIDHLDLTTLPRAEAAHQISASAQALGALIGAPIRTFAYPSGQLDAGVERMVKAAGLKSATSTQPGTLTLGALADPYALPRYRIEHDTGIGVLANVAGEAAAQPLRSPTEVRNIARKRIEGNDAALAERIGAALLDAPYPEQLLKVRALRAPSGTVIGIVLSGRGAHGAITRDGVVADAAGMVERAFAASPSVVEVDVWAIEPLAVVPKTVSGDLAEPTTRTVFSAAVTRDQRDAARTREQMMGAMYFEAAWLTKSQGR